MYQKLIQSGNLLEVYEYQYEPNNSRKARKRSLSKLGRRYTRNVARARNSFFRLVKANLNGNESVAFLTLTTRDCFDIREGWRRFTQFSQKVRRERQLAPFDAKFVAVPEFQKRGAIHFHVLVWGLAPELPCLPSKQYFRDGTGKRKRRHICESTRQCERNTRRLAELWGHGYVDLFATDASPRLASYMAKYMSKSLSDPRLVGVKCYSASRRLVRSVSFGRVIEFAEKEVLARADDEGFWSVVDKTVDKGMDLLTQREYDTKWLGRCRVKTYKLN